MSYETYALVVDDGSRSRHSRQIQGEITVQLDPGWEKGKYVSRILKTPCTISYIMHDFYKYRARSYTKLSIAICAVPAILTLILLRIVILSTSIIPILLFSVILVADFFTVACVIGDTIVGCAPTFPILTKYIAEIKHCRKLYDLTKRLEGYKEVINMTIEKKSSHFILVIDFVDFCGYKDQVKSDVTDFQGREVYNAGDKDPFCYIDLTERYFETCK